MLFLRPADVTNTNRRRNELSIWLSVVCLFRHLVEVAKRKKTNKGPNNISFCRLDALCNATEWTNDKMESHFVVLAPYAKHWNERTTKRQIEISFRRFFVLAPSLSTPKSQNTVVVFSLYTFWTVVVTFQSKKTINFSTDLI